MTRRKMTALLKDEAAYLHGIPANIQSR